MSRLLDADMTDWMRWHQGMRPENWTWPWGDKKK